MKIKLSNLYNQGYYELHGYGFSNNNRSDHERILKLLEIKKNDRVLEIGCGLGILLSKIRAKYKVGTEVNNFAINFCRKAGLSVIKAYIEKGLAFKNFSFDIIIMNEVISHLQKPDVALKECYRLLKSKGKIVITSPIKSRFFHNLSKTHLHEMTAKELNRFVQNNGFRIIVHEVNGISFLYPILENLFFKIGRFFRAALITNQPQKKNLVDLKSSHPIRLIDFCHKLADQSILKPLSIYRRFLLELGLDQLILAEKN